MSWIEDIISPQTLKMGGVLQIVGNMIKLCENTRCKLYRWMFMEYSRERWDCCLGNSSIRLSIIRSFVTSLRTRDCQRGTLALGICMVNSGKISVNERSTTRFISK